MLGIVCEGICETCISVSISAELGSKWGAFGDFFARRHLKTTPRGVLTHNVCHFGVNGHFGAQGSTRASICSFCEPSVFSALGWGQKLLWHR